MRYEVFHEDRRKITRGDGLLIVGAFDEQIAFVLPQEGGSGRSGCWRIVADIENGTKMEDATQIIPWRLVVRDGRERRAPSGFFELGIEQCALLCDACDTSSASLVFRLSYALRVATWVPGSRCPSSRSPRDPEAPPAPSKCGGRTSIIVSGAHCVNNVASHMSPVMIYVASSVCVCVPFLMSATIRRHPGPPFCGRTNVIQLSNALMMNASLPLRKPPVPTSRLTSIFVEKFVLTTVAYLKDEQVGSSLHSP
ncbi:hypothetical protein GGR53DRAFT_468556 [Hypoxylon sp. FL1150]|nr:hypothetical protein GGR53DRAFT_468556 [Hypoxylon sp. FL1150]